MAYVELVDRPRTDADARRSKFASQSIANGLGGKLPGPFALRRQAVADKGTLLPERGL
jgi:hypothetical protein